MIIRNSIFGILEKFNRCWIRRPKWPYSVMAITQITTEVFSPKCNLLKLVILVRSINGAVVDSATFAGRCSAGCDFPISHQNRKCCGWIGTGSESLFGLFAVAGCLLLYECTGWHAYHLMQHVLCARLCITTLWTRIVLCVCATLTLKFDSLQLFLKLDLN